MDSQLRKSVLLLLLLVCALVLQLPGGTQNLSSSSNNSAAGLIGNIDDDVFSDDTPETPRISSAEIDQRVESFSKSLPNDVEGIYGTLDRLLRMRVEHWHYPNVNKLSIWMGECQSALRKATDINDNTEYQNSFRNHTPREISNTLQQKHQIDDCYNAWSKAYNEVLTNLPHGTPDEEEPRFPRSRAAAQKAIELAESVCHFRRPATELLPPNPEQNRLPPLAPQRPGTGIGSQSPLVFKGRTSTNAHFE